jgi:hypothetical protein
VEKSVGAYAEKPNHHIWAKILCPFRSHSAEQNDPFEGQTLAQYRMSGRVTQTNRLPHFALLASGQDRLRHQSSVCSGFAISGIGSLFFIFGTILAPFAICEHTIASCDLASCCFQFEKWRTQEDSNL